MKGFVEYPPRSPDLTPLDFFFWGYLKDKVFATKPATVAELREAIEHECAQIPKELFHDVCDSIAWSCQQCLDQNGLRTGSENNNKNDTCKLFLHF